MTFSRPARSFVLGALSRAATRGWLTCGGMRLPCAIGRSGQRAIKREGDGATPIGRWPVRQAVYRADQMRRPRTALPLRCIRPGDGWCDDPHDRNYNRPVRLPYPASAEELWRRDALYDLVIVIGYNDRPRRRGAGSAIFMHLARAEMSPTAGCIALTRRHLVRLASMMRRGDVIRTG